MVPNIFNYLNLFRKYKNLSTKVCISSSHYSLDLCDYTDKQTNIDSASDPDQDLYTM